MKYKRRITLIGIAAICGVCAIGWSMSDWIWLPHPRRATQPQLLRWLILRDAPKLPTELQLVLVDRLEEELQKGIDTGQSSSLSEPYVKRLSSNVAHLKQLWFVTRCRQYEICDHPDKGEFLGSRLKTIWSWAQFQIEPAEGASDVSAIQFFDDIEQWVEQADTIDRVRMELAVRDGFVYWLAHHDLDGIAAETRMDLARRIVRELNRGMGKGLTPFTLTVQDRQLLRKNFMALLEAWFGMLAADFEQTPEPLRNGFTDKILDQVVRWNLSKIWGQTGSGPKPGVQSAFEELNGWIERSPSAEKKRLKNFGQSLRSRAIWKWATG